MQITSADDLCRIRWWYIRINGRSENASLALWTIMVGFQYHIVRHLCNDYPQMVITYCCLVKGNPGLIQLHFVWESGTVKHEVLRDEFLGAAKGFLPWCNSPISFSAGYIYGVIMVLFTSNRKHRSVPLSSNHHGTWQLKVFAFQYKVQSNPLMALFFPGVRGEGRKRWKCGSDGGMGVPYCNLNFCIFQSLLWEGLLCPQWEL